VLQFFSWRFMFFLVLPIAVIALVIGGTRLVNVGEQNRSSIDLLSVALTVPAFGLFVFGLNRLGEGGRDGAPLLGIAALLIGVIFMVVFAVRQIRLQTDGAPLLDLRVFSFSDFRKSLIVTVLAMIALFGMILVLPLYLQQVRGLSTLGTGLLLLPGGVLMAIMSPITGRLYDRYGPRVLMMVGTGLLTLMLITMALTNEHTPIWLLAVQYAIMIGGGMGLLMTPAMTNGLNPLPPHLYSHGSATMMTLQQVAGAAGSALLIALLALRSHSLAEAGAAPLQAQLGGYQLAFLAAAVGAAAAFVMSMFVTRAAAGSPDHAMH
jgi:DHA2 family lincomycin resistance protein-like MFS transporter